MGYLDKDGLIYYTQKLGDRFIQTVNFESPINGNVNINKVPEAENLVNNDAIEDLTSFTWRTSAANVDIDSGDGVLAYIEGNSRLDGYVEESLAINPNPNDNGIIGSFASEADKNKWRGKFNEAGQYEFAYVRTIDSSSSAQWQGTQKWYYQSNEINISEYGITITNLTPPSIFTIPSRSFNVLVTPTTWVNKIGEDGQYTFVYRSITDEGTQTTESWWELNTERITGLNEYGITINDALNDGDNFIVIYTIGTPNSTIIVDYTPMQLGSIKITKPTAFVSTGFNQFNKNSQDFYITNATINSSGEIIANSGTKVCYCRAKAGATLGYIAFDPKTRRKPDGEPDPPQTGDTGYIIDVGWCASEPVIGTVVDNSVSSAEGVTDVRNSIISSKFFNEDGYFVVAVQNMQNLCIHTMWDNEENYVYESYADPWDEEMDPPGAILFPTTGINSQGQEVTLPLGNYGMPRVGEIADRLDLVSSLYIQKIGYYPYTPANEATVISYCEEYNTTYITDGVAIYYQFSPEFYLSYLIDILPNYTVNDFGTEEFTFTDIEKKIPVVCSLLYAQNLRNKLKNDVLTISPPPDGYNEIQINLIRHNLLDIIYPIGSIYCSWNATSPADIWGGKWTRITGRFLLGATDSGGTGGNSTASVKAPYTGGEATHTITTAEMAAHTHGSKTLTGGFCIRRLQGDSDVIGNSSGSGIVTVKAKGWSNAWGAGVASVSGLNQKPDTVTVTATHTHTSVGSGTAHNNMPPYVAVYMWRRTA